MEFEIVTNGKVFDEESLLGKYVVLLMDFKRFSTNASDWQEAKQNIVDATQYLKSEHNIDLLVEEDK